MNAKVILCKCPRSKDLYGIRIEERNNDWIRTWAFKITENRATREGYEKARCSGSMQPTPEYPGCPYCGLISIAQCRCNKLFCFSVNSENLSTILSCPWCGQKSEYKTVDTIEFEGKGI